MLDFLNELRRRKVFRVGGVYLATAWGLSVGVAELFPVFGVPEWGVPAFTIVAFLGFPIAVVLAWAFELTPDGVVRETPAENAAAAPLQASRQANPNAATELEATTILLSNEEDSVRVHWHDGSVKRAGIFAQEFFIGRDPQCEVHVNNPAVSRRHAHVWRLHNTWILEDLGSQNGTLIGGERIEKQVLGEETEVCLAEDGPVVRIEVPLEGDVDATMRIDPATVVQMRDRMQQKN